MGEADKPKLAVWHNLPSGGAKRSLREQIVRLAQSYEIHLFTTTLVDDSFCAIEPYCTQVKKYVLLDNPYKGLKKIRRRWQQADQAYANAQAAAKDIEKGAYHAVFVQPCQIEHTPSVLTFCKQPTLYYCHEPLREYYEPLENEAVSLKARVGRNLRRPELIRRSHRDKTALLAATQVLVNSEYSRASVQATYGRESDVCYLGVDTKQFAFSDSQRQPFFLSVGRLSRLKGHDLAIEILSKLPKEWRHLVVVADDGDSEERARLDSLAQTCGVTLDVKERISDDTLVGLYQHTQGVICAQQQEPFGFVPLEGMACGAPVFAVREGGFLETVQEGESGRFITRDPESAAERIIDLLQDSREFHRLATSARRIVEEQWSWETHTKKLTEYLVANKHTPHA